MSAKRDEKLRTELYARHHALESILARLVAEVERLSPGAIERIHEPISVGRPALRGWMWTAEMDAAADRHDEVMQTQMAISVALALKAHKALAREDATLEENLAGASGGAPAVALANVKDQSRATRRRPRKLPASLDQAGRLRTSRSARGGVEG